MARCSGVGIFRVPVNKVPVQAFLLLPKPYSYSTAQVKEPIFFFISRTNFTIRDFPPSGLE